MQSEHSTIEQLINGLGHSNTAETKVLLASLRPVEVATTLEANPPATRWVIWELLDEDARHQSLQHLHEDVRSEFLNAMDTA